MGDVVRTPAQPSLRKAVTWTAVITFLVTTVAQYAIGRMADSVSEAVTSDIGFEFAAPVGPNMSVMIPSTVNLETLRTPFDEVRITRWALNNGGGPAEAALANLTVWGAADRPVILRDIRATNVKCKAAPPYAWIQSYGGGDIAERRVRIDLDSDDLYAKPVENQLTGELFQFPLQVSKTDVERFTIGLNAGSSDCTFRLEIGYEDGGTVNHVSLASATYRVVSVANSIRTYRWEVMEDGGETLYFPVEN